VLHNFVAEILVHRHDQQLQLLSMIVAPTSSAFEKETGVAHAVNLSSAIPNRVRECASVEGRNMRHKQRPRCHVHIGAGAAECML
jgi:hypothetical protein